MDVYETLLRSNTSYPRVEYDQWCRRVGAGYYQARHVVFPPTEEGVVLALFDECPRLSRVEVDRDGGVRLRLFWSREPFPAERAAAVVAVSRTAALGAIIALEDGGTNG